jgi:hypothetical protein
MGWFGCRQPCFGRAGSQPGDGAVPFRERLRVLPGYAGIPPDRVIFGAISTGMMSMARRNRCGSAESLEPATRHHNLEGIQRTIASERTEEQR